MSVENVQMVERYFQFLKKYFPDYSGDWDNELTFSKLQKIEVDEWKQVKNVADAYCGTKFSYGKKKWVKDFFNFITHAYDNNIWRKFGQHWFDQTIIRRFILETHSIVELKKFVRQYNEKVRTFNADLKSLDFSPIFTPLAVPNSKHLLIRLLKMLLNENYDPWLMVIENLEKLLVNNKNPNRDAIEVITAKYSIICPLSQMPIIKAAKGKKCLHGNCFDYQMFVLHNTERSEKDKNWKWKCPICSKICTKEELVIDAEYLKKNSTEHNDGIPILEISNSEENDEVNDNKERRQVPIEIDSQKTTVADSEDDEIQEMLYIGDYSSVSENIENAEEIQHEPQVQYEQIQKNYSYSPTKNRIWENGSVMCEFINDEKSRNTFDCMIMWNFSVPLYFEEKEIVKMSVLEFDNILTEKGYMWIKPFLIQKCNL